MKAFIGAVRKPAHWDGDQREEISIGIFPENNDEMTELVKLLEHRGVSRATEPGIKVHKVLLAGRCEGGKLYLEIRGDFDYGAKPWKPH